MEHGSLSQKGSGGGKGVTDKILKASNIEVVKDGVIPSVSVDFGNAVKEVVSPSVVDETVAKEKQSSLMYTTCLGSYPPLPTQGTTTAGNTPGKSSYANVTGKPSGTKVNFRTFFTPGGNRIDVVVLVEFIRAIKDVGTVLVRVKLYVVHVTAFSEDGLSAIATKLGQDMLVLRIELSTDVELKDNIVVVMPKITREGYYTCNIRVEYEWKPPSCLCCKVFGHVQEQCPKNTGTSVIMNLKKASQTPKGISVGQKMGFKPTKQVYQLVSKKPTTNTSKNKKNNVEPTKEVSKTNPFEVLASVENDVELGTNGRTSNLTSQEVNSSGSSF
ncbi:hypothetical protein Tco_1447358 [Tanacetum coccineum]